jgi:outer membrane protein TolC
MGSVGIRQTLLDFGKGLEAIAASRAEKGSAEQDVIALHNLIQLNAENAFYDVAAAQKLVEVAKKSMAQFKETYRRADMQVKTGVRPPFDRTQAEVELSKAQLTLIQARSTRDLARIALVNIMGMRRQVSFALKEAPVQALPTSVSALDMQRLTDAALRARPEMRRIELQVESARDRLKEQRLQYTPNFFASGWVGDYAADYPVQERNAWGFGVGVSLNLFDGWATTYRVKELKARLEQQQALAKRQSQSIVAEVAAAYMGLVRAEQNETVADAGAEFARENFQYARKRYDADVGTILELLVAETSLVNAEAVQVEARYRYATRLAALQRAVNAPLVEAGK